MHYKWFSLKLIEIKPALKGTGKLLEGIEKYLNFTFICMNEDLNQYKIVVNLFGAAYMYVITCVQSLCLLMQ